MNKFCTRMLGHISKPLIPVVWALVVQTSYAQTNVAPFADAFATPTTGTAPLTVTIDGSGSYDSDGTIVDYQWKSSDGQTASGVKSSLTFRAAGAYDIDLVVIDDFGSVNTNTAQQTIKVTLANDSKPPVAKFTATPTSGTAPLTVQLDASGSSDSDGIIVDYQWNSSDGQTASGRDATMTFDSVGTYKISLVVKDNDGLISTNSAQQTIKVTAKPSLQSPLAKFAAAPTSGTAPLTVQLDASGSSDSDGTVVEYQWNSSDGQTASGRDATMTFDLPGTYKISLVVKDNDGLISTNSASQTISVTAKPKEFIHVPWDRRPCLSENTVDVAATVCNNSTIPQTYQLSSILPSSSHSQCNFTPTPPVINYKVSPTPITVPPGQCDAVTVQIDVPAGLTGSETACYTAIVNNINTGQSLSDEGSILGPIEWCVVRPPNIDMAFQTLRLSEPMSVTFNVTNTGDTAKTLDYTLIPVRSDMDDSQDVSLSINGQEPGIGVSDKLFLIPGETSHIIFIAALTQPDPFSVVEAILMTDVDGDGTQEPLYSTAFLYPLGGDDEDVLSQIRFDGLKKSYDIGDTLTITVAESSATSRSERVDLWVAAQIPTGELVYITASPPFSLEPLPFKTGIVPSETVHSVFELEVFLGMEGKYLLYALYAQEGSNPLVADTTVWRSNLMTFPVWLAQCLPATYTSTSGLLHFPAVKMATEPVQVFEANLQLESEPPVFKFIDATPLSNNAATRVECPIFDPNTGQLHIPVAIEGSETFEVDLQLESPEPLIFNIINVTPTF